MGNSIQLQLPPVEVHSVSRQPHTPVNEVSPTAIFIKAVEDERGWQEKDAARTQGYEPSYWSRIKSGEKPAQLERIARLPVKVQKRFVRRYARALGMEVRDESPADRQRRAFMDLQCALANALREVG
jgi:hypothetical protein